MEASAAAGCVILKRLLDIVGTASWPCLALDSGVASASTRGRWQRMNARTETRPKPACLAACSQWRSAEARLVRIDAALQSLLASLPPA
jgi:hypothetical protein